MNKFIFIVLALLLSYFGISQNIQLEKKLDNVIDIKGEYVNSLGEHIRYEKVLRDKLLRLEKEKLQLYDQNFDKRWEGNLNSVQSLTGDNYYSIASNEKYIYIAQYGASLRSTNVVCQLTRIDSVGQMESIILSDQIELRGVLSMEVIEDNVHIISCYTTGSTGPYTRALNLYYSTIVFDSSLKKVGEICVLPDHPADEEKFNLTWHYFGSNSNNLVLKTYYFKEKNGKYSAYESSENVQYELTIMIDESNKVVSQETRELSKLEKFNYSYFFSLPTKYDIAKYQITYGADGWGILRPNMTSSNLEISSGDLKSGNIMIPFFEMITGVVRESYISNVRLLDIVEDPLNDNLNLILISETGTRYVVTLGKDLRLAFVQEYKTNYKPYSLISTFNNFTNGFSNAGESWGKMPDDHINNAFDFAMKLEDKCQFTVINYDDYQILFTDNKASGESHAFRLVK